MEKLDIGTKVWLIKQQFPYNIIEGTIEKFRPQETVVNKTLKFYEVYIEEYDRLHLYAEELLYTDQQKAIEARKTAIQKQITCMRAEVEAGEKDIERITSDISTLKCGIAECEILLNKDKNITKK